MIDGVCTDNKCLGKVLRGQYRRVLCVTAGAEYYTRHPYHWEKRSPKCKSGRAVPHFSNLLNNAIKYSDGDLVISLSETGEITFSNTASELNEVRVGKLFDRFYTVEAAKKSTGLGLSIAQTLVRQMNGTISARYEDNRLSISIQFP